MRELLKGTDISSEILLRSVIIYLKTLYKEEIKQDRKLKLNVCIEKLEIVLDRLIDIDKKQEVSKFNKEKKCGTCLFYVRDHDKKGHTKKCKLKRDFYPKPDNEACDSWRSKGIG